MCKVNTYMNIAGTDVSIEVTDDNVHLTIGSYYGDIKQWVNDDIVNMSDNKKLKTFWMAFRHMISSIAEELLETSKRINTNINYVNRR